MQIARLIGRVAPRAMHGDAVIPHHQIMRAPDMGMDEFALGTVFGQITQHGAGFGHRHAMNLPGMGRKKQRKPPGLGMAAHQALRHRRPSLAFFFCEIGEAQNAAREDLAVIRDHVTNFRFHGGVQSIPGGAHIGEFRIAALTRDHARRKQGIFRGRRLEG